MSESAISAKSAKQIFANFVKFVKPIFGTTRRSEGSVMEAEYPTNYQRISNLSLTIRPFRVAILAVLLVFVGGRNSVVLGADCNYTVSNFVSSKNTEKNGDKYLFGRKNYYDVPTFEFGNVTNNYGISHVKLSLKFGGLHAVTEKFQLQYKVGSGSWTNIGSQVTASVISTDIDQNVSIAGASGQKVYFRLERVEKAKFTDTQTLTLSGFEVRMASNVAADKSTIDFGTLTYGNSKSEKVTATYTLNYSGDMTATCTGDYSATVTAGCNCSTSQQTKEITVTFTPTQAGTRTGKLTIKNPNGTSTTVDLTGVCNRANPTLNMSNNGSVNVTTDKANPVELDLSTLKASGTTTGIGAFDSFVLQSADASTGAKADGVTIDGSKFSSTVGGKYTVRATTKQNNQYNSTYKDFTVTVNRLTQTISWSTDESVFVEEDVISATSIGDVTLTKSGAGAEYVTIEGNTATVGEVESNSTVTLTATAAQTDVYAQATDSKTITLTSLQKQHITFEQNLTKLKTTDGTKKVELVATSDSGRDSYITFAVDANAAGVSVTHEGDKWYLNYTATAVKGIAVTASLAGVEGVSIAASDVSQMVKVTDPTAKCDITETLATAYGIKSTDKVYDLTIPKEVVLKVRCSEKSLTLLQGYEIKFYNAKNQQVGSTHSFGITDGHYNTQTVQKRTFSNLDKNITKLVFTSNASKGYDITEASYTRWSYATPSESALTFEAQALSTVADQTFTLDYANYQIELSIEGSSNFVLKSEDSFGDCETYDSKTVKVGYNVPSEAMEETAYLRIKDNTGALLNTVELHATVIGGLTQNITSTNIQSSYLTTDLVNLTATTDRGLTNFSYSATPTGVANFDGAQMTFSQSGTIAITVTEAGNGTYAEATKTIEGVKVNKATPTIVTKPTAGSIAYFQTLSNSTVAQNGKATVTLRGVENTEVAGTWAWTNAAHQVTDIPGTNEYEVTFTPTDGGMYNTNTCMVPVTILRANQSLSMNNGTVKVSVDGIDKGKADSYLDLNSLIQSQTTDVVNAVKRDGNVTYAVISANADKATIDGSTFSATEIGDYTIRATKAETGYYNVVTAEFTVTVEKRVNTLATAAAYTKYVDEVVPNVATTVNSDGEIHTSSSDASIAYYNIAENKISIPNSEAKPFDQTTVTIKIWQDGTTRFEGIAEADAKIITLTVKKYDNPFVCSWGGFAKTVNFDEVVPTQLTTKNTDYTHFPIEIEQTSGEKIAALVRNDDTNNTITASHFVGDATWHMIQPESYKYKASEANLSLSVRVIDGEECFILDDNSEHEFATGITDGSGHFDTPIPVLGPVDKLYFSARKNLIGVNKFIVQYSVDNGSNWRTIAQPELNLVTWDDYGPYDFPNLANDERVTHIRFGASVGGTLSKYYKNIKISRKTNIQPLDADGHHITTLTLPQNTVGSTTTAQFYLNYSSCDDVIKIVSDNAHFTVDQTKISVDHSKDFNNATITVSYKSEEKGTHTGTITIYTKYQNETLTVTGKTDKKNQTLTWEDGYTENQLSLPVGLIVDNVNYAVSASSEKAVIYTSSDESVIKIIQAGLGFEIVGEGTATLTATQAGDDDWFPVSESKTINATYKKLQEIVWPQDFIRNMEVGVEKPLEAKVYIRNLKTGALTYNASQTALITYSCPPNTVIALDGDNKKITVQGYGQTSITASLPTGSEYYEDATPVTLIVKVRKPSDGCETPWVLDQSSTVSLFEDKVLSGAAYNFSDWTTPELTSDPIILNPENGKPGTLSYQHDAEIYTIRNGGLLKFCSGTVVAQQRVNGIWQDIEGSEYTSSATTWNWAAGAYEWREVKDLQLEETADAIRFRRLTGGTGHHNFKDIQISLLHYLRPTTAEVDLGDITIGEDRLATVGFDYSDIKKDLSVAKGNEEDKTFSLGESTVYVACGTFGHYDLPITVHPTELGEWSNTVIVTDKFTGELVTIVVKANVVPEFIHTYETAGVWGEQTHWKDEKKPTYKDDVRINADVTIVSDITVNAITIESDKTVTVNPGVTLTLRDGVSRPRTVYGNLHVKSGAKVNVGTGAFMINDFILDAALGNPGTPASSGQLLDEYAKFIVNGDAYFQLTLGNTNTIGWYDFVVPFNVDVTSGISIVDSAGNVLPARHGEDYVVMRYSEAKRAERGKDWIKFNGTMQAGRVYTIAVDANHDEWNTVLFKKNKGAALGASATYEAECSTGEAIDCGWNGLGNGTLQHMKLEVDSVKIQVYNHTSNVFETRDDVSGLKFAVGTSFFTQVDEAKAINFVAPTSAQSFLAPARERRTTDEFRLALTAENTDYPSDRLWVSASEEATGEYVVGHDLLKMGTPSEAKVAQMWANNAGNRLCDIEMPLATGKAKCELGIFAPQEANYTLSVEKMPDDAMLYLTYNGRPVWNLTYAPYTFDLTQGFTEGYGLQISVTNAPQVTTGVDEVQGDDVRNTKVIIDNKMFVITPQGAMYDATGKKIQ